MNIRMIPAKPQYVLLKKKRVSAYCRVSTQQEIQYHSLETQIEYYEKKIKSTPYWEFAPRYFDKLNSAIER